MTASKEDELKALKDDAVLAPNKPLSRLAIYKWLYKHDIHIHSDEVLKLDQLIQAIHEEQINKFLEEVESVIGVDFPLEKAQVISFPDCYELKIRNGLRQEQRQRLKTLKDKYKEVI